MKKSLLVLVISLAFITINHSNANSKDLKQTKNTAKAKKASNSHENIAKDIVTKMSNNNFEEIRKYFDAKLLEALSKEQLEQAWSQATSACGNFKSQEKPVASNIQGFKVLIVKSNFDSCSRNIQVVFDAQGKVGGLWIKP